MRKIYAIIPAILLSVSGYSQCNAGYETPTFSSSLNAPANTIFTLTANAASAGTLTGISFYDAGMSTANIKCCVYDDNGGAPGNLIASTASYQLTMVAGPVTLTVTPVFVPAGNYHIGAVIDAPGNVIPYDAATTLTLYAFPSSFSNPFPATGSSFVTTNGNAVNIWMNITCSAAGIQENDANSFSVIGFPSPAHDLLTLKYAAPVQQNITTELFNSCGELVLSRNSSLSAGENTQTFDLSTMSCGIYFVRISDDAGNLLASQKFVHE